jgi:hypothetical protein
MSGKIVICLVNDQDCGTHHLPRQDSHLLWTLDLQIEEAARHGAAGILIVHTTERDLSLDRGHSSWTGAGPAGAAPDQPHHAGWIMTQVPPRCSAPRAGPQRVTTQAATRSFKPVPLPLSSMPP